jgi:copper(I)-binding protein
MIEDAWARPVPVAGGNGAVYLRLINTGGDADQLVGGECSTAKAVEVHKTTVTDGVMKMEPVPSVEIPARGDVQLEPGGLHIMLIELNRSLAPGDTLPITLHFEEAGDVDLEIKVGEIQ